MESMRSGGRIAAALSALLALALIGAGVTSAVADHRLNQEQQKRLLGRMNSAPPDALKNLPGMSDAAIGKVLAFRESGKKFTTTEEVRTVAGLTAEEYDALVARFQMLGTKGSGMLPETVRSTAAGQQPKKEGSPLDEKMKARAGGETGKDQAAEAAEAAGKSGGLNIEARAKYYSILPGYDLTTLSDAERKAFLETINTEMCPCGCEGETLGYCLVNDPGCPVVKARVKKIYQDITGKEPPASPAPEK